METLFLKLVKERRILFASVVRRVLDYHMKVQSAQLEKIPYVARVSNVFSKTSLWMRSAVHPYIPCGEMLFVVLIVRGKRYRSTDLLC